MIIGTVGEAAQMLGPFVAGSPTERLAVLHLDAGNRLLGITLEPVGAHDQVELAIPSILKKALLLGAASIVIAHNHPSGDPAPSEADRDATAALSRAAAGVEIRLNDHIIFAGDERRSFRAMGLL